MTTGASNDDIMAMLSRFAESVDQRFESIDQRFEKQEKFNLALMKRLDDHEKRLESIEHNMATKDDIRQIESTLDGYASKIDTYAAEMAAMQHKIDRLEAALRHLATESGVSLEAYGIS